MKYTLPIQRAIKFSVKTHEVYQKQKRKGKDVPYITHPLSVGMILSLAGAKEEVVIAGILHDTIEDSIEEKKVTRAMIEERFGGRVAELVESVTEKDRSRSWDERRQEARDHILSFDHDMLLLKSADILANTSEIIDDHRRQGDKVFNHFSVSKEKTVDHYLKSMALILKKWSGNPLYQDLKYVSKELKKIM